MNDTNDNVLKPNTVLQGKFYTYTIQKVLGQGTFGITYLATTQVKITGALGEIDTIIQVAIKEFFMRDINGRTENTVTTGSQGGVYANYKKKFAREAENLSKLDHPHIVKVLEYFEANNTVYYAMEYVEGGNLDAYITQHNGLPEAECVKYARQIGSALSYMHAHKMLHLDLKPGNIMLRPNKDAVLIDFGLSKQYNENGEPESSTSVGSGTPGYAPLEQANYHEGKDFPVTMDVYALGATMFKMLTGVRPPEASVILNDGFPAYELQKHHVGDALTACVGKAMAALRKDRPQNIDAFLELLGEKKESTDKKRIRLHNSIDNILFSFTDSPIPGYRSFIAKFTRASATVQTFIENELITKETIAYSPAQFEALISAINALKLYKVSSNLRRQSMGGETIRLGVENKLDVYHYGTRGSQEGTLIGDVYPLLDLIKKEIPGLSGLWVKKQESPHVSEPQPTVNFWQKHKKVILGGVVGGLFAVGLVIFSHNTQNGSPDPGASSAMDSIAVESPYLLEEESSNDIMQTIPEEINTDSIAEDPPKTSTENQRLGQHYTVNEQVQLLEVQSNAKLQAPAAPTPINVRTRTLGDLLYFSYGCLPNNIQNNKEAEDALASTFGIYEVVNSFHRGLHHNANYDYTYRGVPIGLCWADWSENRTWYYFYLNNLVEANDFYKQLVDDIKAHGIPLTKDKIYGDMSNRGNPVSIFRWVFVCSPQKVTKADNSNLNRADVVGKYYVELGVYKRK